MKTIDCKGLACPGPVIQAKKTLEKLQPGESFAMEVDSEASRENVHRFAASRRSAVKREDVGEGIYRLIITAAPEGTPEAAGAPPVVFIASETVGNGDDKLGRILMEGFVSTLAEQDRAPDSIMLMNAGVKLATEGSPVLDLLKIMTDKGCEILVCGTCLDYFGLKERLGVGIVSNMFDIQGALLRASSVIRP
jgi:selenium metabolism protein YedF